ncbi:TetR/AcrR family transcriptional regulator [Rhizobium sp. RCAM05973]|uniref:TetR/AcrR family transcriptional regulator n=1 Tax=Rhizobium sp. RCAM05973 TaxID=2994066 RepID=UPI0022EBC06F|nr:TetR/AcrR family transcriptional regulator [Rhizobium sp. RCAM05973]
MKKRIPSARKASGHTQRGQCAKRISILDAAAEVFCREGFSGASIDEIAMEACVSRQTIYNHYREKETLFMAVVQDVMDRANAALFSVLATFPNNADDLENELAAFAAALVRNCSCNHDGKFLRRMVQTEGERYPHLFEAWRKQGPGRVDAALAALLARLSSQANLAMDDFDLAARQFLALINADLQMIVLFGETPTDEQLQIATCKAVQTFLRAYVKPSEKTGATSEKQLRAG